MISKGILSYRSRGLWRREEGNSVVSSFGLHDGLRQSGRGLCGAVRSEVLFHSHP
jgi:hypothetical protein